MMEFASALAEYKGKIDALVEGGFLAERLEKFVPAKYAELFARHTRGGKRLRAFLFTLGFRIASGAREDEKIVRASLSAEVFQTGVLAHDDIIDKSDLRRGRPSVHVDCGDGWLGLSRGICVGDLGLMACADFILSEDFGASARAAAYLIRCFARTIGGELRDIDLCAGGPVSEEEILQMFREKTAEYTLIGPMSAGAILGGAGDALLEKLAVFGENLGLAFQIVDDVIGIFGDEKEIGKSILSDAREGKKTLMSCYFERRADALQSQVFRALYGSETLDANGLETIRKLFASSGALDYANRRAGEFCASARAQIEQIAGGENARLLDGLCDYLAQRKA